MESPDIQRKIALELTPQDFISLCAAKKEFYVNICRDEKFWRLKIERDYPEIFNYFRKNNLVLKNPKETYIRTFKKLAELLEEYSQGDETLYKILSSSYNDYRKNPVMGYDSDEKRIRKYSKEYNLENPNINILTDKLSVIRRKSPLNPYIVKKLN